MKLKMKTLLILLLFPPILTHSQASALPFQLSQGCELEEVLPRYFKAYEQESTSKNNPRSGRVLSTLLAAQIQNHVFSHLEQARNLPPAQRQVYQDHYSHDLHLIDSFSTSHSVAIFDLARKLQFHWESRFAQPFGLRRSQKKEDRQFLSKAGGTLGIIALGVLLMKSPQNSPRYFRIVRHFLPLSGAWLGDAGAGALSQRELKDFPPAPAHLMQLGLPGESEADKSNDKALMNDFISLAAGVAAASGTAELWNWVKTARALNALSSPAKINPYVFLGSLIVGTVTEVGVANYIEYKEKADLREEVRNQIQSLDRARRNKDRGKALMAGERLKRAILSYSLWHWRPIVEISQEFQEALVNIEKKMGSDQNISGQLQEVQENYAHSLRTELDRLRYFEDPSTNRFITLRYLRSNSEDELPMIADPKIRSSYRNHQADFRKLLEETERAELHCSDSCAREQLFQRYLDSLESDLLQELAFEIRSSVISEHPNRILLQGAALLLSDPDLRPLLETQADELLALIDKNQNLIIESGIFTLGNKK